MSRLILFDVDGTLIRRGDPDHLGAIDFGVRTVFPDAEGATVMRVDVDGKVDRLIASEALAQIGKNLSPDDPKLGEVFVHAGSYYRDAWEDRDGGEHDLLPGIAELIGRLRVDAEFDLAVMTGGSEGIVAVKLRRLGLADALPVGSFGNEVPNRPALVPLALERSELHYGRRYSPRNVLVVGDTPADVTCAHVHGIACLGVASGKYSIDELRDAGADVLFEDLTNTEAVRDAMLTHTGGTL